MKRNKDFSKKRGYQVACFFCQALVLIAIILFAAGNSTAIAQKRAESVPPVIVIHAKCFAFTPSRITLETGKTVRLVFVSEDVMHSIAIPSLGIEMSIWKKRLNQVVITPAIAGDFSGECTRYCGKGHDRMKFVVHVAR